MTTASGTISASARTARSGVSVRVYAIASSAFGVKAWQWTSGARSAMSQRSVESKPISAKTREPRRESSAHQEVSPARSTTAARASGAPAMRVESGSGRSWPWVAMARSPSAAMETVRAEWKSVKRREADRSMPSSCAMVCHIQSA